MNWEYQTIFYADCNTNGSFNITHNRNYNKHWKLWSLDKRVHSSFFFQFLFRYWSIVFWICSPSYIFCWLWNNFSPEWISKILENTSHIENYLFSFLNNLTLQEVVPAILSRNVRSVWNPILTVPRKVDKILDSPMY